MPAPLSLRPIPLSFIPDAEAGFIIDISYSVSAFPFVLVIPGNCQVQPLRVEIWLCGGPLWLPSSLCLVPHRQAMVGLSQAGSGGLWQPPPPMFFSFVTVCPSWDRGTQAPSPALGQRRPRWTWVAGRGLGTDHRSSSATVRGDAFGGKPRVRASATIRFCLKIGG